MAIKRGLALLDRAQESVGPIVARHGCEGIETVFKKSLKRPHAGRDCRAPHHLEHHAQAGRTRKPRHFSADAHDHGELAFTIRSPANLAPGANVALGVG